MKKNTFDFFTTTIGILLLVSGLLMAKTLSNPQGILRAFPYICIGIGCGVFGHGIGNIVARAAIKNSPNIQKQIDIEKKDERNVSITNYAKAKAYDMMIFIFGAQLLAFALMGIDLLAILLLTFTYLFVVGYCIFYRCKYDKEM
jgi:hypothetical protein